jgi:hypothetical protein
MSADLPTPTSDEPPPSALADSLVWFVAGAAGVALLFAASVYVPPRLKLTGLYGVGLGTLAGWALGQWAVARRMKWPALVAGLTWGMIAAGEVLAAVETHRLGLKPERSELKPEQVQRDFVTEGMREYYSHEPEGLSDEGRDMWRQGREFFERGEKARQAEFEARQLQRSFYGYLANRIDAEKLGKWSDPWPVVFWSVEVLVASTVGAWLALRALRAAHPRELNSTAPSNLSPETQGGRG